MDTITITTDALAEWNLKLLCEELAALFSPRHPFVRGRSDGTFVALGRHDGGDWLQAEIDVVQTHLPLHDATAKTQVQQARIDDEQAKVDRRDRIAAEYDGVNQLTKDIIDEILGR